MKKAFSKFLVLSAISISAHAQVVGGTCSMTPPTLNVQPIIVGQEPVWYQDILNRCTGYISDMMMVRMQASQAARMGQLNQAANMLANKLAEKAAQIPVGENIYPHTMEAIRSGNQVVQALMDSTSLMANQPQTSLIVGQVRYKTADRVYQLIEKAFHRLDEKYFMSSVKSCWHGCHGSLLGLPSEYYEGVRVLAQDFLNLQKQEAPTMAFDSVELAVAAETVSAAKNILLTSVFRRDYACVITDLHNLEWEIRSYNQCGGILPSNWFVDSIRARINSIYIPGHSCGDYTVYPQPGYPQPIYPTN